MSTRLATALREAAETVPAYEVHDAAVALGRRRRRRSRLGTSVAVVALVALVGFGVVPLLGRGGGPLVGSDRPVDVVPAGPALLPETGSSRWELSTTRTA